MATAVNTHVSFLDRLSTGDLTKSHLPRSLNKITRPIDAVDFMLKLLSCSLLRNPIAFPSHASFLQRGRGICTVSMRPILRGATFIRIMRGIKFAGIIAYAYRDFRSWNSLHIPEVESLLLLHLMAAGTNESQKRPGLFSTFYILFKGTY